MNTFELKSRKDIATDVKLGKIYAQFEALLTELSKVELPQDIRTSISTAVEQINSSTLTGAPLRRLIKQNQSAILKQAEKELKLVPKNYYRNLWLALGMSVFGLPLGVAFALSVGNMALLGIGLPVGMAIGSAVGTKMDKKAYEEGRQLDIEIKL